jgi:hypothetical protein
MNPSGGCELDATTLGNRLNSVNLNKEQVRVLREVAESVFLLGAGHNPVNREVPEYVTTD